MKFSKKEKKSALSFSHQNTGPLFGKADQFWKHFHQLTKRHRYRSALFLRLSRCPWSSNALHLLLTQSMCSIHFNWNYWHIWCLPSLSPLLDQEQSCLTKDSIKTTMLTASFSGANRTRNSTSCEETESPLLWPRLWAAIVRCFCTNNS